MRKLNEKEIKGNKLKFEIKIVTVWIEGKSFCEKERGKTKLERKKGKEEKKERKGKK